MSLPAEYRARCIGAAARAALHGGALARVFAAFERSFYVETSSGIACIGGPAIGRGPLNVIVDDAVPIPAPGAPVTVDFASALRWIPSLNLKEIPPIPEKLRAGFELAWRQNKPAQAFLNWIAKDAQGPAPRAANALIGLGPGLTPAGDDFVGGALIALRAAGHGERADRIAAWALALAERGTNRISRAHLRCAAAGEGHEALYDLLRALNAGEVAIARSVDALSRVGHSSGLDAAAGALLILELVWRARPDEPGHWQEVVIVR